MQVEVLTGVERRRRWSYEEKVRLVEETLLPGVTVSEIARRRGVAKSLLFAWRRQALSSEKGPLRPLGAGGEGAMGENCHGYQVSR